MDFGDHIINIDDYRAEVVRCDSVGHRAVIIGFFAAVAAVFLSAWAYLALCHSYVLWSFFGRDYPWYIDFTAGVLLAPVTAWLAPVCLLYRLAGEAAPFFHM